MEIRLANTRGFCAGVDRAIEIVKKVIEMHGAPVYVKHEVVHNKTVVEELKNLDRGYENTTIIGNLEVNSEFGNFELSSWSANGTVEYLVFGSPVSQKYENYAKLIPINFYRITSGILSEDN